MPNRIHDPAGTPKQSEVPEVQRAQLAGLFHDVNNLVCTVVGNVDLAVRNLPDDHPAAEGLRDALAAGRRLRDLVDQGAGVLSDREPEAARFRVDEAIATLLPLLLRQTPRGATVQTDLVEPLEVQLPRTQFDRVLANLVGNALRAVGPGGTVGIEAGRSHLTGSRTTLSRTLPPGPYLRVSVEDDGHGIEPGLLAHIFQPGFTLHATEGGRGLGMAVEDDVIHRWDGGIEVESEVGRGARFLLWIPLPA